MGAGLLLVTSGSAATTAPAAIEAAAERWIRAEARAAHPRAQRIETRVRPLDRRLSLAACEAGIEAFLPPGGRRIGRTAVGVRCAGPRPWQLYVQVEVRAFVPVLVAARALERGTILDHGDVRTAVRELSTLRRAATVEPEAAVGHELRRRVARGAVLHTGLLAAPRVIRRGQQVSIRSATTGVQVRMGGRALEGGAIGDLVRVRNASSGRIVEGRVVGPGRVRVER